VCALLAFWGKAVSNTSIACDDWMDMPLGILTLSGICGACVLVHGTVADKKLLVQPESKIDVLSVLAIRNYGVNSHLKLMQIDLTYDL
jgi:hypothetical protein